MTKDEVVGKQKCLKAQKYKSKLTKENHTKVFIKYQRKNTYNLATAGSFLPAVFV